MAKVLIKYIVTMIVGLLPGAPGTYGSALVAGIAAVWLWLGGWPLFGTWYVAFISLLTVLALWACRAALAYKVFGDDQDPSPVVIDEAVGVAIAMYGIASLDWRLPAAFIAFRFFDILKPFPVGWSQKLPGQWGIVIDDMLAGLYALLAVRLMQYGLLLWFPALAAG